MVLRSTLVLAATLLATVLPSLAADKPDKEIVVRGSKLTPEQAASLENGRSSMSVTPAEMMNMLKTGEPSCKDGAFLVGFDAGKFLLEGASIEAAQVVEIVKRIKSEQKLSCLWVDSSSYDRASFDALDKALVGPLKVSLFWPELDGKQGKPGKR